MTSPTLAALRQELDDLRDRHNEAMQSLAKWTIDVDNHAKKLDQYLADASAQVKVEEPPMLTDARLHLLSIGDASGHTEREAAARLRFVEPELARLRARVAGLEKEQEGEMGDWNDRTILIACDPEHKENKEPHVNGIANWSLIERMAREIARRRGLKVDGAS